MAGGRLSWRVVMGVGWLIGGIACGESLEGGGTVSSSAARGSTSGDARGMTAPSLPVDAPVKPGDSLNGGRSTSPIRGGASTGAAAAAVTSAPELVDTGARGVRADGGVATGTRADAAAPISTGGEPGALPEPPPVSPPSEPPAATASADDAGATAEAADAGVAPSEDAAAPSEPTPPATGPEPPPSEPPPSEPPPSEPPPPIVEPPPGPSFETAVWPIFKAQCAPCHTTLGFGGHLVGSANLATAYADATRLGPTLIARLDGGGMPQGCAGLPGTPGCISVADLATIQLWIDTGEAP